MIDSARARYAAVAARAGLEIDPEAAPVEVRETDGKAVVRISGPLDAAFGFDCSAVVRELDGMKPTEIDLVVASPGGDYLAGLELFAALRSMAGRGARVSAECVLAASAASVVLLGADHRRAATGALAMIHDPWAAALVIGGADGIEAEAGAIARSLRACADSLVSIYSERTALSETEARAAMAAETWYEGDALRECGLVNEGGIQVPEDPSEREKREISRSKSRRMAALAW